MFIFGGTKQEMEAVGYVGVTTCRNCDKSTHHVLYQLVKSASVYFIPVANWRKGSYVICEGCSAGTEVSNRQADLLLRECRQIPEPDRYADIWDSLIAGWRQEFDRAVALGQKTVDFGELQRAATREAQSKFPEAEVDFVHNWTFAPTQLREYDVLDQVDEMRLTLLQVLD